MAATSNTTSSMSASSGDVSPYLHSIAPQGVILEVLGILITLIDIPCFFWHTSLGNLPAAVMVFWIMADNIVSVIMAFIWPYDDLSTFWHGIGFCDVETKIEAMSELSKIACALCILHALAKALDMNKPRVRTSAGRGLTRERVVQIFLCIIFPVYYALAQFIISSRRFEISALNGCDWDQDLTWIGIPLMGIWMPILCYIAAYYAILIVIRMRRYRRDLASALNSTNSGLSKTRFLRLLGVSGVFIIGFLPYSSWVLYTWCRPPYLDADWSRIHDPKTWQTILLYQSNGQVSYDRWIKLAEGLVIFGAFGFGKDIKSVYVGILSSIGVSQVYHSVSSSMAARRSGSKGSTITFRKPSPSAKRGCIAFDSDALKNRAQRVLSRLNGTKGSSGMSQATTDVDTQCSPSYAKTGFMTEIIAVPPAAKARPMGLAEKDLYDIDEPLQFATPDPDTISIHTVVEPHNADIMHTRDAERTNLEHSGLGRGGIERSGVQCATNELLFPSPTRRTPFWQRIHNYVNAMGPRPAANMGGQAYAPNRRPSNLVGIAVPYNSTAVGVSGRRTSGGDGASAAVPLATVAVEPVRDREYEAYVMNQLV